MFKKLTTVFAVAVTMSGGCTKVMPDGSSFYVTPTIDAGVSVGYVNPYSSGVGACSKFAQAISQENRQHCKKKGPQGPSGP